MQAISKPKKQNENFKSTFNKIINDFIQDEQYSEVCEKKQISEILLYNVPGGKNNRGLMVINSYKILEDPKEQTLENIRLAHIMGWCVEMFHSYFCICDDIMDQSITRRGKSCWYRVDDIGFNAINDAFLIQSAINFILCKNFNNKPYYKDLLELFNDISLKTLIGQHLDNNLINNTKPDLTKFTMKFYNEIAKYKTGYYTFYFPIALAMLMTGIHDPKIHQQAKNILLEMGRMYQIQDDYIDCYGDPAITGKIGTDIESGKCTWLAITALQKTNQVHKKIMNQYYGSKNPEHVAIIKKIYNKLNIPELYIYNEETTYTFIKNLIHKNINLPHSLFLNVLNKLYKRSA